MIVLTTGEYSDYGIEGYIVARVDFDIRDAAETFLEQENEENKWDCHSRFIAWLISTEKAVPVEHREIHISDYGNLTIS